jgi:autotransporter-associated beta strand protein
MHHNQSHSGQRSTVRQLVRSQLAAYVAVAISVIPAAAWAQGLLGNINGAQTGGVVPATSVWQKYTYGFDATTTTTNIGFVFRNDPSYTALDNVTLVQQGSPLNLLINGGLDVPGGTGANGPVPAGWFATQAQVVGTSGMWQSGTAGAPPFAPQSGAGYWYDGSAGGFDGVNQMVMTIPGDLYTLTFWLGSNVLPNGTTIDTQVYAGPNLPPGQSDDGSVIVTYTYNPGIAIYQPPFSLTLTADTSLSGLAGSSGAVALGPYTLTLTAANSEYDGVISGSGNLTLTGGTQTLGGANLYTGITTIGPGSTLALTGTGSIGASSQVLDNGTLDISATTAGTSITTLSGTGTVALGFATLTLTNASGTFSGTIAGNGGSLTIAAGTETLSGINTYYGTTTIAHGATLALSGTGRIANSPVVANGTLDISQTTSSAPVFELGGSGSVVTGSQTLTITLPYLLANPLVSVPVSHPAVLASLYAGSINCYCGGEYWLAPSNWFNANNTFAGTISGNGAVDVTNMQQALTGTNTYAGGTVLTGAALMIANDASLGAASRGLSMTNSSLVAASSFTSARAITLTAGNVIIPNGNSVTLSGPISGTGSLLANGGGTLTLTGTNSYSGGTSVLYGTTLAIGSDAALGATSGALVFEKGILLALGNLVIANPVVSTGGGGLIDPNGYVVVFTGPLTLNSGLYPIGSGELVFGDGVLSASANGTMSIAGGTYAVDTVLDSGGLTVTATGILRGTGTVDGPTVVYGTLAPGHSPGTLTFNGPLALAPGSVTQLDIDGTGTGTGAGNYSRILVTGAGNTATLGGTLLPLLRGITGSATNTYTPPLGQSFQVISADGGLLGSFSSLTQPAGLATGTRFDALYGPTALTLVVTPSSYGNLPLAGIAETADQQAAGSALDALRPAAGTRPAAAMALFNTLYLVPAAAITSALDQVGPTIYGDGMLAARDFSQQTTNSVMDQIAARRDSATASNVAPGPHGSTLWMNGIGQFTNASGTSAPGYQVSVGGAVAGVDVPVTNDALIGFAVGGGSVQTQASNGGQATGNTVEIALYGGVRSGSLFLDAEAAYLHMDENVQRDLNLWGTSSRGSTTANGGGVQIHGGTRIAFSTWYLEPTLGLSVLSLASPSLNESSVGGLAEQIGAQSTTSVQTLVGVRVGTQIGAIAGAPTRVSALLGWTHEFADVAVRTTASFNIPGATPFAVDTVPVSRDAALLGGGFDVTVTPAVSLYGAYTASVGRNATSQDLTGGIRVRW